MLSLPGTAGAAILRVVVRVFVLWPVQVACVRLFQCCCVVGAVIVGMAAQSKDWLMQAACYWQQSVAAEGAANVRPFMSVDLRT